MVPARNVFHRQRYHGSYGGYLTSTQLEFHKVKGSSIASLMAEDDDPGVCSGGEGGEGEEAGTSSKDQEDEKSEGWLQLGLGGNSAGVPRVDDRAGGALLELNLFSDRPPDTHRQPLPITSTHEVTVPLFPTAVGELGCQWEAQRGFQTKTTAVASTSGPSDYNWGRFTFASAAGCSGRMRVVSPRPRPQTGVWLVLQAAKNQEKEPFLPQIPRTYLRIKDGRMTVRLLMKYLANKLGLEDESQVEITCRGQRLPFYSTLQDVRDHIWCSREAAAVLPPDSPSTDHVMTLQYSRAREG